MWSNLPPIQRTATPVDEAWLPPAVRGRARSAQSSPAGTLSSRSLGIALAQATGTGQAIASPTAAAQQTTSPLQSTLTLQVQAQQQQSSPVPLQHSTSPTSAHSSLRPFQVHLNGGLQPSPGPLQPPTHGRHRSLGAELSPHSQALQLQLQGAASTSFYLPEAPQAASAASSDSPQTVVTTASATPLQLARHLGLHQEQPGLSELVRRLSWDEAEAAEEEASMAPEAASSPTPLHLQHHQHHLVLQMHRASHTNGSAGTSQRNSIDFGCAQLSSQPPSPVLAAMDAAQQQQRQRQLLAAAAHQQALLGVTSPVLVHAAPVSSPDAMSNMDLSMSPVPSPQPDGPQQEQASSAGLSGAEAGAVVSPRFGSSSPSLSALSGHRKFASCPLGLSDMRLGGGNGQQSTLEQQTQQQAPQQMPSPSSRAVSSMRVFPNAPMMLHLHGSPSSSPPHTPSSPSRELLFDHPAPVQGPGSSPASSPASAHQSPLHHGLSHPSTNGAGGKLTPNDKGSHHSHSFHPYARTSTSTPEQLHMHVQSMTAGLQQAAMAHQQQASSASTAPYLQHRPTVISPASRFLNRANKPATLPAALMHHHTTATTTTAASSGPGSGLQQSQPISIPIPPLSLHTLSGQQEWPNVERPGSSASSTGSAAAGGAGMGGVHLHLGSLSAHYASASSSPPSSPHASALALAFGAGANVSNGYGAGMRTPTSSPPHRGSFTQSSPSFGGSQHPATLAGSLVNSVGSSPLLPPSAAPTSAPHADPSALRLPTPDFSAAFDARGSGWSRLSNHSPLKHRSLPGTPSLRGANSSVPPTPNSRVAKQSRSRRHSALDSKLLESAALLLDFSPSALAVPLQSLPLMHQLPSAPSFDSQVLGSTLLGSGSFGDVYRLEMAQPHGANPFAAQQQQQQQQQHFLAAPQLDCPSTASSASSVGSVSSSACTASSPPPSAVLLALKRSKVPFVSQQDRQRMLGKYTHIFGLVQAIQAEVLTMLASAKNAHAQQQAAGGMASQPPTLASICAAMHVDPATFFPRHLVSVLQVWQEQGKLHTLMPLCERGDLTSYWGAPAMAPSVVHPSSSSDGGTSGGNSVVAADELIGADGNASLHSTALPSLASSTVVDDLAAAAEDDEEREEALRAAEYQEALLRFTQEHGDPSLPVYLTPARTIALSSLPPRPAPAPLTEATLWRLLGEVCSALALLHKHGVLHLDVKPANILVTADGDSERFVLADFDSCVLMRSVEARVAMAQQQQQQPQQASSGLSLAALLGSGPLPSGGVSFPSSSSESIEAVEPGDGIWCAPELLRSSLAASGACDVFSLGCSVYAVLMDHIPDKDPATGAVHLDFGVSGGKDSSVPALAASEQLRGHCVVSSELQQLLHSMTSSHPSERPTAAQVVALASSWAARAATVAAAQHAAGGEIRDCHKDGAQLLHQGVSNGEADLMSG